MPPPRRTKAAHSIFGEEEEEDERPRRTLTRLPSSLERGKHASTAPPKPSPSAAPAPKPSASPRAKGNDANTNSASKPRDFSFMMADPPEFKVPRRSAGSNDEALAAGADGATEMSAAPEEMDMAALMGFSGFGKTKTKAATPAKRAAAAFDSLKATHVSGKSDASPATATARQVGKGSADGGADARSSSSSSEGEGEGEEEEEETTLGIPMSHEISLDHDHKPVSALCLDPAGGRLVTGGYAYQLKFWEFNSMDTRLRPFRSLEPCGSHAIRKVVFNQTGSHLLVISGSAQAKVLDRNGLELFECLRGDTYLFDLSKTYGHIAQLNGGAWHPRNRDVFITCSNDSTVRVWNVNEPTKTFMVGKCRSKKGQRIGVSSCTFNRDGKKVACGCLDGSIQIFSLSDKIIRPYKQLYGAHAEGSVVTAVAFARDGFRLVTRATDDTMKCWDMRKFRAPEHVLDNLPCFYDTTDCVFSPDERWILTGTSAAEKGESGTVVLVDAETFVIKRRFGVPGRGVISVAWHLKINQIILGCSDGNVKVFFNPKKSVNGALLCANRAPRKADPLDMQFGDEKGIIVNPHALKLFREDDEKNRMSAKRKREKARQDAKASRRPEAPVQSSSGIGNHGRLAGFTNTMGQYIARRTAQGAGGALDEDPREAILRHAEAAEKNPFYVAPAYQETQPDAQYDTEADPNDHGVKVNKMTFDPNKRPSWA